ncbi:hypothetical protein CLCR_09346 [Cladophialophora carrionii]|uniref:Uncharacterized protein n=1 Tax=Cladophialophora carrionii TaxID=86049 RepID=A0A1C1CTV5_9EURO|nr:hypothetical protein CLCR_09346 [Cladophialophora carrionii]
MLSSLVRNVLSARRSLERRLRARWPQTQGKAWETLQKNGLLGFICFGGPPVHFQIVSVSYNWDLALATSTAAAAALPSTLVARPRSDFAAS